MREITPSLPDALSELILHVDHIAIAVKDIDVSVRWYSTALGFTLVNRHVTHGEHTSMLYAVMQAGQSVLVLLQGTSPESQVSRFIAEFGSGVHHIAFAVADLDAAIVRAEESGSVPDTPVVSDEGVRQVFLRRDPASGIRVELVERRGGSFTEKNVEHLFRAMEAKGLC
jgi:methylmalonyl-CoA epimerase